MADPDSPKPKLIIDEDWKTQVEREREEARQKQAAASSAASPTASPAAAPAETEAEDTKSEDTVSERQASQNANRSEADEDLPPLPPASFLFLVSMLGTQALAAMGQLDDGDERPTPNLQYAKHYIDLLAMLEEKSKGNLADDEAKLLGDWLYQLRMGYVEMAKSLAK